MAQPLPSRHCAPAPPGNALSTTSKTAHMTKGTFDTCALFRYVWSYVACVHMARDIPIHPAGIGPFLQGRLRACAGACQGLTMAKTLGKPRQSLAWPWQGLAAPSSALAGPWQAFPRVLPQSGFARGLPGFARGMPGACQDYRVIGDPSLVLQHYIGEFMFCGGGTGTQRGLCSQLLDLLKAHLLTSPRLQSTEMGGERSDRGVARGGASSRRPAARGIRRLTRRFLGACANFCAHILCWARWRSSAWWPSRRMSPEPHRCRWGCQAVG